MSKAIIATAEIQELSLKISPQQVVDFLNHCNPDAKCSFCQKGDYGVGYGPSGENAAVVAAPVPNQDGTALWFYPATCISCGHVILFNAITVAEFILEKK